MDKTNVKILMDSLRRRTINKSHHDLHSCKKITPIYKKSSEVGDQETCVHFDQYVESKGLALKG